MRRGPAILLSAGWDCEVTGVQEDEGWREEWGTDTCQENRDCGERQRKVPWSNTLVVKYNVEEKRCMARTV